MRCHNAMQGCIGLLIAAAGGFIAWCVLLAIWRLLI